MDERNLLRIERHLTDEAAQRRVYQNIQRGRNEVTVTIGRAARLFGFSESQLRDWEKIGLITPLRPRDGSDARSTSGTTGQRQYSFSELDKLAIIRELIDEAHMTPGSIPTNVDEIWEELTSTSANGHLLSSPDLADTLSQQSHALSIDERIRTSYREKLGWRFYASRVLWLSLMIVYEDIPGFYAGLILPSQLQDGEVDDIRSETLTKCGPSLVGWLGQTSSFFTFLTQAPFVDFPTDYIIVPLCPTDQRQRFPDSPANRTLIVIQRVQRLHLRDNEKGIRTVQRLLEPLYEDQHLWNLYFGDGMNEQVNPGMDFRPKIADAVLTDLTNMIIRLGGVNEEGKNRWSSCCIMQPDLPNLPIQRRNLIVRAKSDHAPQELGVTATTPERNNISLSQRAYQGGHIVYRSEVTLEDTSLVMLEIEGPIRSNIAVPIGGESGHPQGVLYVASFEKAAFDEDDQRVLRIVARVIEELLCTYDTNRQATKKMLNLLEDPGTTDMAFKEFFTENQLLQDVEKLLLSGTSQEWARQNNNAELPSMISFIGIDIDTKVQDDICNMYGDQTLGNLNKALGLRIRDLLPTLFINYSHCKLYHIYAGRYYLFLRDVTLEKCNSDADQLKKALKGNIAVKQSNLPGSLPISLELSVHLGVTWYSNKKLAKFLSAQSQRNLSEISSTVFHSVDLALKSCTDHGGDNVFSWNPDIEQFEEYLVEKDKK